MKGHIVVFILIAIAIITAAIIAMTYFVGLAPQDNRGAAAVPNQEAASGNQSYFTLNPTASQENTENNESTQISSTAVISPADDNAQNTYIVKTYNGIIGVFADQSETPIQTVEVTVSSLPEGDQQSLEEGISVKGTNALRRLLEDYES